jgi:hypothetical protein
VTLGGALIGCFGRRFGVVVQNVVQNPARVGGVAVELLSRLQTVEGQLTTSRRTDAVSSSA